MTDWRKVAEGVSAMLDDKVGECDELRALCLDMYRTAIEDAEYGGGRWDWSEWGGDVSIRDRMRALDLLEGGGL